jgi:hypothetical protein
LRALVFLRCRFPIELNRCFDVPVDDLAFFVQLAELKLRIPVPLLRQDAKLLEARRLFLRGGCSDGLLG